MVKKLMLAVAAVALLAAPAFAAVQNVKVSGDLKTTSVIRQNMDLTYYPLSNKAQNLIISQVGINVQADLTDNVSTMIRLSNERIWGSYNGTAEDYDIDDNTGNPNVDTAYVTMKEFLYSPLTVTIGRQPLVYGNSFLIGDGDRSDTINFVSDLTGGVNFDAVKAVLSYDPLTIDLFAAKMYEGSDYTGYGTSGTDDDNDVDLYGINANYKFSDKMATVVEAYTFIAVDRTVIDAAGGSETKADKGYFPGLRVSTNPIEGLNVQLEGTYEFGDMAQGGAAQGKTKKSAYGLQGMVNYALPVLKDMKPVVSAGYTYLSGDKDGTDNKDNDFYALYENQNGGRIFDTLYGASNLKLAELAFEIAPITDVVAKLSWYNLSMVKKGTNNSKIGNEYDLDVTYAYTEDVKFGLSTGLFVPGKYWGADQKKDSAAQILTSVAVAF